MKKVLFLIFASLLVLGACGNDNSNSGDKKSDNTETKSVNENKTQFANDTLVIDQAVLKLMILLFLMTKIQVINY